MRTPTFINFVMILLFVTTTASAAEGLELRGSVAAVEDGATYTWDPQNFAGFSYEVDDNIGTERLTLTITDGSLDEPMGVVYETTAQLVDFEFEDWGSYHKIFFLGEEHFAGYAEDRYDDWRQPYLYDRSKDSDLMAKEELSKILIDDDQERTITKDAPLRLAEGYELGIKGIDAYGSLWLELTKDGEVVDSNLIAPSKEGSTIADKTYIYTRDLEVSRGVVLIAVHFKGPVFHGTEGGLQEAAIVNGIWQISGSPFSIEEGSIFGKMRVSSVDIESMHISMDNQDNRIILGRNKGIPLMEEFWIKTADQDEITAEEPLRFYVFKEITRPGSYEIRGSVSHVIDGWTTTWDSSNFPGFYYDVDENLGTERLTTTIHGNALVEPDGVVYTTSAQKKEMNFPLFGSFWTIGFLGEAYFAGYADEGADIGSLSRGSAVPSLLAEGLLSRVLIDDDEERIFSTATPLKLTEGYELLIRSIDSDTIEVNLDLLKDGRLVDTGTVEPAKLGATPADKTYTYQKKLGDGGEMVIIAVHFKNAFGGTDQSMAIADGIWQISDDPLDIGEGSVIDKMTIQSVDDASMTISMSNEGKKIALDKDGDIPLVGAFGIRTADQDEVSPEEPLRFYVYKLAVIEETDNKRPPQEIALI